MPRSQIHGAIDSEHYAKLANITVNAWRDPAYMRRLKDNPNEELTKAGVPIPEGKTVVIVDHPDDVKDVEGTIHAVLPPHPPEGGMTADDLEQAMREGSVSVPGL